MSIQPACHSIDAENVGPCHEIGNVMCTIPPICSIVHVHDSSLLHGPNLDQHRLEAHGVHLGAQKTCLFL
eukprot:4334189-Prorocentrum_lima.AAC.1